MKPITRVEHFLARIVGEDATIITPITRIEYFLAKIAGDDVQIPEPITRKEMFLAKIAGESQNIPTPITRFEKYLAAIAGEGQKPGYPITRIEYYLDKWQSDLPSEYRRTKGFAFDGNTYYKITDFKLNGSDTVRISFSVDKACNVFGCYTTNDAEDNYSLYASTANGAKYLRYDGTVYNSQIPSSRLGERFDVTITPTGTNGLPNDSVITPVEFTASADLCVGVTSPSATSSKLDGNIWGDFIVDGRLKLIPCERESDGVLGYYDSNTRTFYEPIGSAPRELE